MNDLFYIARGKEVPEPMPDEAGYTGRYTLHIVGEQFVNKDGVTRQFLIRNLLVGDLVTLINEKDNPYGAHPVRVDAMDGTVGYLPARNSEWVFPLLEQGVNLVASVASIFADTHDGNEFLNVMIHIDNVPRKAEDNPIVIVSQLVERVDEERKTWKGQRRWLLCAKEKIDEYNGCLWVKDGVRSGLNKIGEFIDSIIEKGDVTGKTVVIDMKYSWKKDVELAAHWAGDKEIDDL